MRMDISIEYRYGFETGIATSTLVPFFEVLPMEY
jgi:hypothetical protein